MENHNNANNYQEQIIDFSSSPTAAQENEMMDSNRTQHSLQLNGHLKNYNEEENEDDEHTSLLTYRDEFENSPSKRSNNTSYITGDKNAENGHLLSGENSGRLSSSSNETEGADEENNNSDDSSVVIRQGTSNFEHGQQQFQHSKLENESRIEEL